MSNFLEEQMNMIMECLDPMIKLEVPDTLPWQGHVIARDFSEQRATSQLYLCQQFAIDADMPLSAQVGEIYSFFHQARLNYNQPTKSTICPCGIARLDCGYHNE